MPATRTYLQQLSVTDLVPARVPELPVEITRVEQPAPEFCRFLYATVGAEHHWVDRLSWTKRDWSDRLRRAGLEVWVCWLRGAPVGYAELHGTVAERETQVELAYFGLFPDYLGQGLGGQLLTTALRRAWSLSNRHTDFSPVSRVWVHTTTLDGPHALANYKARGMHPYLVEQYEPAPAT